MYRISNFTDNDDVKVLAKLGAFEVIEYQRDLSVTPGSAVTAYYCAQMNVRKHHSAAPLGCIHQDQILIGRFQHQNAASRILRLYGGFSGCLAPDRFAEEIYVPYF